MRSTILIGAAALFTSAFAETTGVYVTVIPPECSARECIPPSSSLNALDVLTAALATIPNALSVFCSEVPCPTQSTVTLTTTLTPYTPTPTPAQSFTTISTSQRSESLPSSTAAPTSLVPSYPHSTSVPSAVTPVSSAPVESTSEVQQTTPSGVPYASVPVSSSASYASVPGSSGSATPVVPVGGSTSVASPVTGSSASAVTSAPESSHPASATAHSTSVAGAVTPSTPASSTNAPPVNAGIMKQPSLMGLGAILGALLFV